MSPRRRGFGLPCLVAALALLACSGGPSDQAPTEGAGPAPVSETGTAPSGFVVYALSRGRGVPAEAMAALDRVVAACQRDHERGLAVEIERTLIGLEGETRVCIRYEDPSAESKALEAARALLAGADLVDLVVGPCPREETLRETTTPQGTPVENR